MNARHYRFSGTALPVNEIRKRKNRDIARQDCGIGNLRYPIIDWVAFWRQLYRVLNQLLSAAGKLFAALFAFVMMQLVNLKRYLMMKEELLAEEFYEAMDSFFVMDTMAEHLLVIEPLHHQNSTSSGQRLIRFSVAAPEKNVHSFSLTDDFNKSAAKPNMPTHWTNENHLGEFRYRQTKSSKLWFWKRWFKNWAGVLYINDIMHLFLKIQPTAAHPKTIADCMNC
ncbi:MAG TPA: hypothetical protein VFC92_12500 [Bacteroidales bacterium]|nr:hypothetical protein [Bacteroidales bacterium]